MEIFNPYKQFVGSFIPNCLMKYRGISSTSKLVWARLAQYAGEKGEAYPKQETLADELGISTRQVIRCLAELQKDGFILVEKAEGRDVLTHKSNRYSFILHDCFVISGSDAGVTSGSVANVTSYKKENHLERESKDINTLLFSQKSAKNNGSHSRLETAKRILEFMNSKRIDKRGYKPTKVNLDFIIARIKEGYVEQDFKSVIAIKWRNWKGTDQEKYFRPSTIFNREKFNQYYGELGNG